MHDREKSVSTYVGNNLAIPHGTNEAKLSINRTGLSFIRYSEGIDWNGDGQLAHFVVGIAGAGDDHLTLLGSIAHVFLDEDKVAAAADRYQQGRRGSRARQRPAHMSRPSGSVYRIELEQFIDGVEAVMVGPPSR